MEVYAITSDNMTRGVFSNLANAKSALAQMLRVDEAGIEWHELSDSDDAISCHDKDTGSEWVIEAFELDEIYYIGDDDDEGSPEGTSPA